MDCSELRFKIELNGKVTAHLKWPETNSPELKRKIANSIRKFIKELQEGKQNYHIAKAIVKQAEKTGHNSIGKKILTAMIEEIPIELDRPMLLPEEMDIG